MKIKRTNRTKIDNIILIICTMPNNVSQALTITKTLIVNKLAACVTLLPNTRSVYYWNNNIEEKEEIQLLIKTHTSLEQSVFEHIKTKHPYQMPELLTFAVTNGEHNYLSWIHQTLTEKK